jgi:hypothetical protein
VAARSDVPHHHEVSRSNPAAQLDLHYAAAGQLISPRDTGSANWNDPIQMVFDELMDRASVEAAFSLIPQTRGTFQWDGNILTFTPPTEWEEGLHYVITLDTSLKTAPGEQPLHLPQQLSFTTLDENGEVSFGYGPKFQVVDPAGRRAVQFSAWGVLIRPITARLCHQPRTISRSLHLRFSRRWPNGRQAHPGGRSQTAAHLEDRR